MKIKSIFDKDFSRFGRIVNGDFEKLLSNLLKTPMPNEGTIYSPSDAKLESNEALKFFKQEVYGGLDVQLGFCNGHNQILNCLEYHKGNEINLSNEEFVLLLGSYFDVEDGVLNTSKVEAFKVPAKTAIELYSTTLHYAPCGIDGSGFKVLIVLPKGTNVNNVRSKNDPTLWATNKWLLAHKDSNEAKSGAHIGLTGENIKV